MNGWVSPRLGIKFVLAGTPLVLYRPDGTRFFTFDELALQKEQAERQKEQAERQKEQAVKRANEAEQRARRLAERLRALGIDPEA
jgi:hypothetical protein